MKLIESINKFMAKASIETSFLTGIGYKDIDYDNPSTPESAFFKLSEEEMIEDLNKRFSSDIEKSCNFIDFYVNRSIEYMENKDILKFINVKERLRGTQS